MASLGSIDPPLFKAAMLASYPALQKAFQN
jgi:hypothetical protein